MRKLLGRLGVYLANKFSTNKTYDPIKYSLFEVDKSALIAMRELMHLSDVPEAFEQLPESKQDIIRSRCKEYSEDWVFHWLIDNLVNEQIRGTMLNAIDMKELDAGRYSSHGALTLKEMILNFASVPYNQRSYDKHQLIDNI